MSQEGMFLNSPHQSIIDRVEALEKDMQWFKGSVGILANAEQYNKEKLNAAYDYAKAAYDFLKSHSEEFCAWFSRQKDIYNIERGIE